MTTTPTSQPGAPAAEEHLPLTPAAAYEAFAVPTLFAPAAERLLAAADIMPGERVLDVGTGTGIVARLAARRVGTAGTVAGLDASAAMLDEARAAAEREGLAIAWHEGRAERLPFPDASFDVLLSQYALMFFTDSAAALAEMRRVLAPGGRIALSVFQEIERHPLYQALEDAIARQLGRSTIAAIFALGERTALTESLVQAGFQGVSVESWSMTARMGSPEKFLAGEIELDAAALPTMQDLSAAERRALVAAIGTEMAGPLQAVTKDGEVVMPFHTLIARAWA